LPDDGDGNGEKHWRYNEKIEPTSAEIELTGELTREDIIQAIEKAGYKISN
jgi:hypothetical protein